MASENENGEERTEEPSGRRLHETRHHGQTARSVELSQVAGIIGAFIALRYISPSIWLDLITFTKACFTSRYSTEPIIPDEFNVHILYLLQHFLPEIAGIMLITAICGALCTLIQTEFLWSSYLLRPKFNQLNPLEGFKRIFSSQNFVSLLKSIAKLSIICPIGYYCFFDLLPGFVTLITVPIVDLLPWTADAATYVFKKIMYLLLVLAVIDYIWQCYVHKRDIKMTRQEAKEERKTTEGDMATKRKMQSVGFKRIREKMMLALPTADVVVTNPTHYAVALKYDFNTGAAPRVLAKGKDHLAELIKKRAREYGIPIIERKPLARALFAAVEIGQEIPYELFKAVAELLAYVYKLRGKNPFGKTGRDNKQKISNSK
ncbi:MAG: EscU/YscU/HrcU family type III secretion system export apparatus switch protein [Deltaproteobacteria bacterium]|nr:EscU/YscU/HrcU family type III secretion system export apparatus switch protein [Deltaproteobacteria bacterium]